jgi:diacylglycerol kinase family enzyme
MKEMKKIDKAVSDAPGTRLKIALGILHEIISTYKGRYCEIQIDDKDYSGNFLLAEVMNTSSIGPNLNLAPFADPGDGFLEVVLIPESQREEFADYVLGKLNQNQNAPFFQVLKAKRLQIHWEGKALHVDDEYLQLEEATAMKIEIHAGLLEFLVPASSLS